MRRVERLAAAFAARRPMLIAARIMLPPRSARRSAPRFEIGERFMRGIGVHTT
jgi:hypothetical protein